MPESVLRQIDSGLWVTEVPLRSWRGEIGRRMTVVEIDGGLWLHSPAPLAPTLRRALDERGGVRFVVAPSRFQDRRSRPGAARSRAVSC